MFVLYAVIRYYFKYDSYYASLKYQYARLTTVTQSKSRKKKKKKQKKQGVTYYRQIKGKIMLIRKKT